MRHLSFALVSLLGTSAYAAEQCYQLSRDGQTATPDSERLCVTDVGDKEARITLSTGGTFPSELVAFSYSVLERARCVDCNATVYGVKGPATLLGDLRITFDGKKDPKDQSETGKVRIGQLTLAYRSVPKLGAPETKGGDYSLSGPISPADEKRLKAADQVKKAR